MYYVYDPVGVAVAEDASDCKLQARSGRKTTVVSHKCLLETVVQQKKEKEQGKDN